MGYLPVRDKRMNIISYFKTKRSFVKAEACYINRIKTYVSDCVECTLYHEGEKARLEKKLEAKDMLIIELEEQIEQLTSILANRDTIDYYKGEGKEI